MVRLHGGRLMSRASSLEERQVYTLGVRGSIPWRGTYPMSDGLGLVPPKDDGAVRLCYMGLTIRPVRRHRTRRYERRWRGSTPLQGTSFTGCADNLVVDEAWNLGVSVQIRAARLERWSGWNLVYTGALKALARSACGFESRLQHDGRKEEISGATQTKLSGERPPLIRVPALELVLECVQVRMAQLEEPRREAVQISSASQL